MDAVKPITGRQAGELCRLLEEREAGGEEFQFLIEHPDQLVEWIRAGGNVAAPTVKRWGILAFLKEGESPIGAKELGRRARELRANDTRQDAEYLLANQNEIPVEVRKFILAFPGWRDRRGYVACLFWDGRRWELYFGWLDHGFDDGCRLVRVCE